MSRRRQSTVSIGGGSLTVSKRQCLQRPRWRLPENFSDWTVIVGTARYHVHRSQLAVGDRASTFFQGCFNRGFEATDTNLTEVLPTACHGGAFETALDFMYDADIHVSADTVAPLLKIADILQMEELQKMVREKLTSLLTATSCTLVLAGAQSLQESGGPEDMLTHVYKKAMTAVIHHFQAIPAASLAALPSTIIEHVLTSEDLCTDEDRVFDVLASHMELATPDVDTARRLWSLCRFGLLPTDRLRAALDKAPAELVSTALLARVVFHEGSSEERERYTLPRMREGRGDNFKVKYWNGSTESEVEVRLLRQDDVKDLKVKISVAFGVAVNAQHLWCSGFPLDDQWRDSLHLNSGGRLVSATGEDDIDLSSITLLDLVKQVCSNMQPLILCAPLVSGKYIHVITLTGKMIHLKLPRRTRNVEVLKNMIQEAEHIPPDQQRLIYKGIQLYDDRTLMQYGIDDCSLIFLFLRLRGDIGAWCAPQPGQCTVSEKLLSTQGAWETASPAEILAVVSSAAGPQAGDCMSLYGDFQNHPCLFKSDQCGELVKRIERCWRAQEKLEGTASSCQDFRMELCAVELALHIGTDAVHALIALCDGKKSMPDLPRFIARRVAIQGDAQGHCIQFHRDVASSIVNVALNGDCDYVGGRLLLVSNDGTRILCPRRDVGSAIVINGAVHAVSGMSVGTRYSLFAIRNDRPDVGVDHGFPYIALYDRSQ